MIKSIIKCLSTKPEVSGWLINEVENNSYESFYVLQKLETTRVASTTECRVTVYHNFSENENKFTGSSSFIVSHEMKKDEINKLIDEALYSAKFVKNRYYEIVKGTKKKTWKEQQLTNDPFNLIDSVATTFFGCASPKAKFNSLEIFYVITKVHTVNSIGVDYTKTLNKIFVEAIPSYDGNQKVELYKQYNYKTVDLEKIKNDATQALEDVKLRHDATKVDHNVKKIDIILREEHVSEFFYNLISDYSFASVVKGSTNKKIGDNIQKEPKKDLLTLSLVSPSKADVFDGEGALARPVTILNKGVLTNYYGNNQYAYYLNQQSTGNAHALKVDNGKTTIEKMKGKPHIEIIALSGIQIDMYSGYIGGEVRLANYFDGINNYPISGFSFSGNIDESLNNLIISKEKTTFENYQGPKYIKLPKMEIL